MSGSQVVTTAWSPRTVGIALAAYQPNPVWLAEQLASIVAQTHTEWVCVITLDSPLQEIASRSELTEFFHDKRFTWVENAERLGVRMNFEKAIQLVLSAETDLIAFCDQDDIWLPEKLAESIDAIKLTGPLTAVYCDAYLLVNDTARSDRLHTYTHKTAGRMAIAERIIQPQVHGFCMLFDTKLSKLHSTIPSVFPNHDYWYSLVAAAYGGIFRIDKPLALYRQHVGNEIGITAVRAAEGWNKSIALKRYSTLRENAKLRANIARQVGIELPIPRWIRVLFAHTAGWSLVLLAILCIRAFSDQSLVTKAYRNLWGLLPTTTQRYELTNRIRKYFPASQNSLKILFLIGSVSFSICALILSIACSLAVLTSIGIVLKLLFVASVLITGFRHLQHQLPYTIVLLAGVGSLSGLVLLWLGQGTWPVVLGAILPAFVNLCYRFRWAVYQQL